MANEVDESVESPSELERREDEVKNEQLEATELVVVGVGASAGGLEALQHLVGHLDAATPMAFVVAQHVSADYRSMMVDLLSRHSMLPVMSAEDGQVLVGGRVYVCPPGYHITLKEGDTVSLSPVDESIYMTKPSIDLFFKSLAEVKGARAIGVILSGTGTDGTSGVGAIKDVDGFSIAQEPSSAKYDGMPASAIKSGKVDMVVPPEDIGQELLQIAPLADRPIPEFRSGRNRDTYERILRLLKRDHGVNFGQYKDKTLSRRIMRRMIATKSESIETYAELVSTDSSELTELFHDLLIGVTDFFRDAEAYNALREELRKYIANKADPVLRVWSVGCSTGEEPYSIAILLSELLGEKIEDYRIQIFATDVNQRSIEKARRGRFSASEVSAMSQRYRDKYFVFTDGHFEVTKAIKQLVVFSQHDVVQDPPFLRQDLVVCRNVMIYFGSELQDALLPTFHYVLHPGALLFLGQAESVGSQAGLWEVVNPASKIFQASATVHRSVPRLSGGGKSPGWQSASAGDRLRNTPKRRVEADLDGVIAEQLDAMLSPNVFVVNSSDQILYSHGDANPLLQRRAGLATDAVFDNIHPDITVDLRTALHRLRSGEDIVSTDYRSVKLGSTSMWTRLVLGAAHSEQLGDLIVVYCQVEESLGSVIVGEGDESGVAAPSVLREHERQVTKLRDQLAIVMEELDNSNEEMQALNEELQSSNEELQSSNEELETTNEELQSTNEELQTAYAELRIAFDEKAMQEAELERSGAALLETNELLEVAETVGRTGSWRWRTSDEELVWSAGLHGLLGTEPDKVSPSFEHLLARVAHDERPKVEAYIEDLLSGGSPEPVEFDLAGETDDPVRLSMISAVELGQYKSVKTVVGKLRDVSEERIAEETAREHRERVDELEQQIHSVLNSGVNGSYLFDFTTSSNVFMSDSYTTLLGWSPDDLAAMDGDTFMGLFLDDERDRVFAHQALVASLPMGETRSIKYHFRHKDGHFIELYSSDTVFEVDDDGKATKMLGTFFVVNEGE